MTNWQTPLFSVSNYFSGGSPLVKTSRDFQLPVSNNPKVLAAGLAVDKCYFFRVLSAWVDGMMRNR